MLIKSASIPTVAGFVQGIIDTMTNFRGAVTLLKETPSDERIAEIASEVAERDFPDTEFTFAVHETLPELDLHETLAAHYRSLKSRFPGSVYLVVYPATEKKTPKNGTIPR